MPYSKQITNICFPIARGVMKKQTQEGFTKFITRPNEYNPVVLSTEIFIVPTFDA